ncbi:MAG: hypothetical protein Q9178_006495 [Gyalolechia marmorata]
MLPRFQIRNLQSPLGQPSTSLSHPASATQSVLVSIDTSVYDELIANCPPAALKYIDDEDGEVVRVGSSLELVQRLQDPVPTSNDHSSAISPYHSFDIDHRIDIVAMWDRYGERTSDHPLDGGTDRRNYAFQATNPPVIKPLGQRPPAQYISSTQGCDNTRDPTVSQSNLTGEGKRQAQAAGDLLRARNLSSNQPSVTNIEAKPATYQNRWASYSTSSASFVPSIPSKVTLTSRSPPAGDAQDVSSAPIDVQLGGVHAVGDKARDGANLVKRTKPRTHVLDSAVNNRRSYTQGHPPKLDNRVINSHSTKANNIKIVNDTQPSLIEVFNNELNRLATTGSRRMDHSVLKVSEPLAGITAISGPAGQTARQREEQIVPSAVERMQDLCSKLQRLGQRSDAQISQLQTVQRGIHAALQGFSTAIQDVADSIQDESNAEGPNSMNPEKSDTTLLLKAKEDLSEMANAASLLQTQILPFLQSYVEKPLRQAFQQPVVPVPSGECSNCSVSEHPSRRFEPVYPHMQLLQDSGTSFQPQNALLEQVPDTSSTCQASRSSDSSSDPNSSTSNCHSVTSPVIDKHSAMLKASGGDRARPLACHQNMAPAWTGASASLVAERRFPTLERFEQESSTRSLAFRKNPDKQSQVTPPDCTNFPSGNAHARIDLTTNIATRELPSDTSGTSIIAGVDPPANQEELIPQLIDNTRLEIESENEIQLSSSASDSLTSWRQSFQSPGLTESGLGDISNQQAHSNRHSSTERSIVRDPAMDVRGLPGTDRGGGAIASDILADATDHGDAATVAKIQACVEKLEHLGFGSVAEGGLNRLVVYAQASGGDLVEAIDLITEERQAYDTSYRRRHQHFLV